MSQVLSGCAVRAEIQKERTKAEEKHACSQCGEPAIVEITSEFSTVHFLCAACDRGSVDDVSPYLFERPPGPATRCSICGRFCRWNALEGYYACPKAYRVFDAEGGGWEHD